MTKTKPIDEPPEWGVESHLFAKQDRVHKEKRIARKAKVKRINKEKK